MQMGKYSIELIRGGEGADIQIVLAREDNLRIARTLFSVITEKYPDRLVMLCDRALVLERHDPENYADFIVAPRGPPRPAKLLGYQDRGQSELLACK